MTTPLPIIAGTRMALQIAERLREEIVSAAILPGQALSETDYATLYGVSRQPVREAFIRLAADGLLEVLPQRGTFVKKVSIKTVADARFVREAVEAAIVVEACQRATPADIAMLKQIIDSQTELLELESSKSASADEVMNRAMATGFLALDEAFHRALAKVAKRETAWAFVDRLKVQMDRVRYLSYQEATPAERLVAQHATIVEAIAQRDVALASADMHIHLAEVVGALPKLRERMPDMFED
ncbi:GntR family transcriptional regulator [Uliginosibacterium gangwonense]|uniref:GntR family transcriptional regulator n=1 Tax=Uliginosibacterium gangwonense TaxID=392736 RepID=UPI000477C98F|nr:GntR family transcriptional regulator [Uliginosibacterium gangwonense]